MRFGSRAESTAELASGVVEDVQKLVRLEIQLAKLELKEMAIRNGVAAGMVLVAATLLMIALLVAGPMALVLLGGHWWWALVWLGVYVLLAAVLGGIGAKLIKPKPERTMESIQETKEWLGDLTSSLGK